MKHSDRPFARGRMRRSATPSSASSIASTALTTAPRVRRCPPACMRHGRRQVFWEALGCRDPGADHQGRPEEPPLGLAQASNPATLTRTPPSPQLQVPMASPSRPHTFQPHPSEWQICACKFLDVSAGSANVRHMPSAAPFRAMRASGRAHTGAAVASSCARVAGQLHHILKLPRAWGVGCLTVWPVNAHEGPRGIPSQVAAHQGHVWFPA